MERREPGGGGAGAIGQSFELPAVTVGARTLRPVARVTGWRAGGADGRGGGGAAWLRVAPVAVLVREADGRIVRLAVRDATAAGLAAFAAVALLVFVICWIVRQGRRSPG